jgi:hypothetical protein
MPNLDVYLKEGKKFVMSFHRFEYTDKEFRIYESANQETGEGLLSFDAVAAIIVPLYPHRLSSHLLALHFEAQVEQYVTIPGDEVIKVVVYAGDDRVSTEEIKVADLLTEDRINELWPKNEDRLAALRQPRKSYHPTSL